MVTFLKKPLVLWFIVTAVLALLLMKDEDVLPMIVCAITIASIVTGFVYILMMKMEADTARRLKKRRG